MVPAVVRFHRLALRGTVPRYSNLGGSQMSTTHAFITYVADRAASREIEALADFYGVGALVVSGEITYETARDDMVAAFKARSLAASTAKVYVSQGYALAQLFETFEDVETFADDECKGSRSLKRIYDATRVKDDESDESGEGEGETNAAETVPMSQLDVVLAALPNLTPAERATVVAQCQALGLLAIAA